jgi:hypothetical protein
MPAINDKTRTVFMEAEKTTLDNFTGEEINKIEKMGKELRGILEEAKKRNPAAR